MAIYCTFTLNGLPSSVLDCDGVAKLPAFSGQKHGRNNDLMTGVPDIGPLPKGRYYIVGRESGEFLSKLRHFFIKYGYGTDRSEWFALYRDDGTIDDLTFIDGVQRGNFRLHPIGPQGLSEGCITLNHIGDFDYLRKKLLSTMMIDIPGTSLKAYGIVEVR
ncbi:DUF2778 domain-containing protein [Erwinia amylovora]